MKDMYYEGYGITQNRETIKKRTKKEKQSQTQKKTFTYLLQVDIAVSSVSFKC